ncbi:hypothetical protein HDU97_000840 [Phlyctochytrium planicorne]|nr:hypothetical protein HDU97_000840 [Phlyctochytrium planicorne]
MTDWFKGRGLAFALGLNLSFARISTALNDNISPWIEGKSDPPTAGWFGFLVCFLSLLSAFSIIYLDRPSSRIAAGIPVTKQQLKQLGMFNEEQAPLILPDEESNAEGESTLVDGYESEEFDEEDDETVHCSQVWGLSSQFWFLSLATVLLYGAAVPFFHICTDFFQQKWNMDMQTAGLVMSVPDWISAVGSPLSGVFLDLYGKRGLFLPISAVFLIITHFLFLATTVTPFVGMSIMGVTYSMFAAALWPCVPYLVGPHQIATGYGLIAVALNVSLFGFPLVVAQIRNLSASKDFGAPIMFFLGLSVAALIVTIALNVLDHVKGGSALNIRGDTLHPSPVTVKFTEGSDDEEGDDEEDDEEGAARVVGDGIVVRPHFGRVSRTWDISDREGSNEGRQPSDEKVAFWGWYGNPVDKPVTETDNASDTFNAWDDGW